MLSNNDKLIGDKLRNIVNVINKHARKNPDFSRDLAEVLNIDTTNSESSLSKNNNLDITSFNPINLLQKEGEEKLINELNLLSNSELIKIVKNNKYKITIDTKKGIENRDQFIKEIINYLSSQLNKGSSFL